MSSQRWLMSTLVRAVACSGWAKGSSLLKALKSLGSRASAPVAHALECCVPHAGGLWTRIERGLREAEGEVRGHTSHTTVARCCGSTGNCQLLKHLSPATITASLQLHTWSIGFSGNS